MITITAVFTGQNGSLGYITGKKYVLTFRQYVRSTKVEIVRHEDRKGVCEYSNVISFFDNWTNIETLKK